MKVADLIEAALPAKDEDTWFHYVSKLRVRSSPLAFDAACRLTESDDPDGRALGADILAQLGWSDGVPVEHRRYRDQSVTQLLGRLEREHDPDVLSSIAIALGYLKDRRCVQPLSRLVGHPDVDVRAGVAFALWGFQNEVPLARQVLDQLAGDPDPEVHEWTRDDCP
jgi:HEAT repeats